MKNLKINLTFDCFSLQRPLVTSVITRCIEATLQEEGITVPCEINVLVTNDRGIQAINKAYRDIDKPTDVFSFPMFSFDAGALPEEWSDFVDPETELCPLGDMAISLERAIAQAREFGHTSRREVGYLTIHSMLHLLGYDHMEKDDEEEMFRLQDELLDGFDIKR